MQATNTQAYTNVLQGCRAICAETEETYEVLYALKVANVDREDPFLQNAQEVAEECQRLIKPAYPLWEHYPEIKEVCRRVQTICDLISRVVYMPNATVRTSPLFRPLTVNLRYLEPAQVQAILNPPQPYQPTENDATVMDAVEVPEVTAVLETAPITESATKEIAQTTEAATEKTVSETTEDETVEEDFLAPPEQEPKLMQPGVDFELTEEPETDEDEDVPWLG